MLSVLIKNGCIKGLCAGAAAGGNLIKRAKKKTLNSAIELGEPESLVVALCEFITTRDHFYSDLLLIEKYPFCV